MTDAHQSEQWLNFYENAWEERGRKIEELVLEGYSLSGAMQKVFRWEYWGKKDIPPEDATPCLTPWVRPSAFHGNYWAIPYFDTPVDMISHYLDQHQFDVVIELGAGLGHNLVELMNKGVSPGVYLVAGEYTKSGVRFISKMFDRVFPNRGMAFHFDWKKPDLSQLGLKGKRVFLFSCHSIEQVTRLPQDLFHELSQVSERVVGFHFEPFGFQYVTAAERGKGNVVSLNSARFFKEREWNENFVEVLYGAANDGKIKVTHLAKDCFFCVDPSNPTSFAAWERV